MRKKNNLPEILPAVVFMFLISGLLFYLYKYLSQNKEAAAFCTTTITNIFTFAQQLPLIALLTLLVLLTLAFVIRQIKNHQNLKRYSHTTQPKKLTQILERNNIKDVYVINSNTSSASCIGFVRPKIYITDKMIQTLNAKELTAVLLHEKYHITQKHHYINFFITFLEPLKAIFPFLSHLFDWNHLRMEKGADHAVVRKMGNAKHILSAFKKSLKPINSYSLNFSEYETIETRILTLQGKTQNNKISYTKICISSLSFVFFILLLTMPAYATEINSNQQTSHTCQKNSCTTNCAPKEKVLYNKNLPYSPKEQ